MTAKEGTITTKTTPKKVGRPRKETVTVTPSIINLEELSNKDIRNNPISKGEIRNAVETYYDIQDLRIVTGNRKSAIERSNADDTEQTESNSLYLDYVERRFKSTEVTIQKFLKNYAEANPIGRWLLSIPGIGPVLAAAILAYIDIKKCETAGSIWSYAGITGDSAPRKKGEKLSHNPKFKTICWKIGQSFIKVSNNPKDIYGKLYLEKKDFYIKKNEAGGFKEKAAKELASKNYNKNTKAYQAYSQGKLPDAQIIAMAQRFATKIFLSHLFEIWYEYDRGMKPPAPFVQAHLGHVHIISAPNREIVFGNK